MPDEVQKAIIIAKAITDDDKELPKDVIVIRST